MPVADHTSARCLLCFFLPLATCPFPHALSLAADKAVSMHQGLCYRSLGSGTCTLPLIQRITKQICCCSRVGKAWGSKCEKCPLPGTGNLILTPDLATRIPPQNQCPATSPAWIEPFKPELWDSPCSHNCLVPLREGGERGPWLLAGTAWLSSSSVGLSEAFREICPAGHGYTYSSSDIRLSMRKAVEEELASPFREQTQKISGPLPGAAERQPLRAVTDTWIEAETFPDKGI